MTRMWFIWLKHRWRGASAAIIALLAVLLVLLIGLGGGGMGLSFLGNVNAPRPASVNGASGTVLPRSGDPNAQIDTPPDPRSSILDTSPSAGIGPQDVAAAQAGWSAEEVKAHQNAVLAAVNCVRKQHRQPALVLDPTLSQTAGDAWLKLAHDPSYSLMALPGSYASRSLLALDFDAPSPLAGTGQTAQPGQEGAGCIVGGFDATTLPYAQAATTIGIAVFPPQVSWDMASAVVLVR